MFPEKYHKNNMQEWLDDNQFSEDESHIIENKQRRPLQRSVFSDFYYQLLLRNER